MADVQNDLMGTAIAIVDASGETDAQRRADMRDYITGLGFDGLALVIRDDMDNTVPTAMIKNLVHKHRRSN